MHAPLAFGITTLVALGGGLALWPDERSDLANSRTARSSAAVARSVQTWLDSLSEEVRGKAQRPLDDPERTAWQFVPGRYAGAELGTLSAAQRELADAVLQTVLSAGGYEKTKAIVDLELVLRKLESKPGRAAAHRDPDRYSLLVVGDPAPAGTYAVRFQGHHVSLQLAVSDGRIAGHTPQFLGTNPHEVRSGTKRGQRVLGAEEDLARAFLLLLDEEQLAAAVIADSAPPDVLLGPGKPPSALGARRGLPWKDMNATQRGVLWRLIEEYANVWHGELAAAELQRVQDQLDVLCFAWAGGRERGEGHYYRIHGRHFAIEYDNTQNGANHVHTVWRDFERDHGGDLLIRHLREQHGR